MLAVNRLDDLLEEARIEVVADPGLAGCRTEKPGRPLQKVVDVPSRCPGEQVAVAKAFEKFADGNELSKAALVLVSAGVDGGELAP